MAASWPYSRELVGLIDTRFAVKINQPNNAPSILLRVYCVSCVLNQRFAYCRYHCALEVTLVTLRLCLLTHWCVFTRAIHGARQQPRTTVLLRLITSFHGTPSTVIIDELARREPELEQRLSMAKDAASKLRKFWRQAEVPKIWKFQVFNAMVISQLTYALESLHLTETCFKKIDAFHMRGLRYVFDIKPAYISRVSNE